MNMSRNPENKNPENKNPENISKDEGIYSIIIVKARRVWSFAVHPSIVHQTPSISFLLCMWHNYTADHLSSFHVTSFVCCILSWRHTTICSSYFLFPTMATAYPTHSFVNSNKGKPLLVIDDYVFQQSGKTTVATTYWACQFKGGGFKEINFLSDCLSYLHSFHLLCLLWWINFE